MDHQPETARSVQSGRRRLREYRRHVTVTDEHGQLRRRIATDAGASQSPLHVLLKTNLKTDSFTDLLV